MIRFKATRNGKPSIGLGLSRENVNRLTAGQPVLVTGASVGMPEIDSVLVFFGETEMEMELSLRRMGAIGSETVTHYEDRPA